MSADQPLRGGPAGQPILGGKGRLAYVALAVALIPQIVLLAVTLPSKSVIGHWDLAWGGFAAIAATGLAVSTAAVLRRSPWTFVVTTSTATVLLIGCWFDLLTGGSTAPLRILLIRLPLVAILLYAAAIELRQLQVGRRALGAAGLAWRDGSFVPFAEPLPGSDAVVLRLAAAAGPPADRPVSGQIRDDRIVPSWTIGLVVPGAALALLAVVAITRRPNRSLAEHWTAAWVGYDVLMAVVFVATAILAGRRSPVTIAALSASTAILACDAWFDTMSASGRTEIGAALAAAVLVEIPLAIITLVIAHRAVIRIRAAQTLVHRASLRFTAAGLAVVDR